MPRPSGAIERWTATRRSAAWVVLAAAVAARAEWLDRIHQVARSVAPPPASGGGAGS